MKNKYSHGFPGYGRGSRSRLHRTVRLSLIMVFFMIAPHGFHRVSRADERQMLTPAKRQAMDGETDATTTLGLQQALEIALENNPDLAVLVRDIQFFKAKRDVSTGKRLPGLNVMSGYNTYLDEQRLIPARSAGEPGVFSQDIASLGINLALPLYRGGQLRAEVKTAALTLQAAEYTLVRGRQLVVYGVTQVYYGILATRHILDSLLFSRQSLAEHMKFVEAMIAEEKAALVDRLRMEVRLADLDQQILQQQNVLALQKRFLVNLLGLETNGSHLSLTDTLVEKIVFDLPSLKETVAGAYTKRHDYFAAQAAFEAQQARIEIARGKHFPSLSLQGEYGVRWAMHSTDIPEGTEATEDVGWLGCFMSVPLYQGGQTAAEIRAEEARLAADQERLRKLKLQIRLDVETAYLNVQSSFQRVRVMEKSITHARESLRIERQKHELSKGTIVDVLDAQTALLNSQTQYYHALVDYHTARANLRLAEGQ